LRYTTKRKILRYMFWLFLAAVIVLLNIWLIFVVKPVTRLEKDLIELDVSIYSRVYPYENGLIVIDQRDLISYDLKGREQFRVVLPEFDMEASRKGNVTVVWSATNSQIYNEDGVLILEKPLYTEDSKILFGRTGEDYFALATLEEGQYKARIYDYEANDIDDMLFPSQSILNIGFYGDSGNQLWALLLDSHGTIPISKVRTDHPGKSMTGALTVLNQVCYATMPMESMVYVVGTHQIQAYSYTSVLKEEVLVYGWTMQDYILGEGNDVAFLMGTNQTTEYDSPVSALWYIGKDNEQFRLSMPTGIIKAYMSDNYIYAFSAQGINVYEIGKTSRNFQKLSFDIVDVPAVVRGKAVVIQSEEHFYLLPME